MKRHRYSLLILGSQGARLSSKACPAKLALAGLLSVPLVWFSWWWDGEVPRSKSGFRWVSIGMLIWHDRPRQGLKDHSTVSYLCMTKMLWTPWGPHSVSTDSQMPHRDPTAAWQPMAHFIGGHWSRASQWGLTGGPRSCQLKPRLVYLWAMETLCWQDHVRDFAGLWHGQSMVVPRST